MTASQQTLDLADQVDRDSVLAALSRHIGRGRGATAAQLVREITGGHSAGAERRLRSVVVELRRAGHHVCAHPSDGYHLAETDAELDATLEYLYDRAMCSLEQIAAMRRVSLPDLRGQLRLRTD